MPSDRPTWASIDLAALAHNYAAAKRLAEGREVIAVVKADAYGHGALPVARRLVAEGCRTLAVVTTGEARELREAGIQARLLVLGGVHGPDEAEAAVRLGVCPVVHRLEQVDWLARAAAGGSARLGVEVEVDTGMRRMGVAAEQVGELLAGLRSQPGLRLEGLYTHLARADEPDPEPTREQLRRFRKLLAHLRARGLVPSRVHVANSAGLLRSAQGEDWIEGDAVRPGLALYGVSPAPHLATEVFRPVMTIHTRVAAVRRVRRGDGVGYGHRFRARRSGWIATLPMGYADGVPWSAGNRAEVLLRGKRRRLAGRVSMDFVTVDLGAEPVEVGEEAILFGESEQGRLGVEELAERSGTIAYELLVRIGKRVPRSYQG